MLPEQVIAGNACLHHQNNQQDLSTFYDERRELTESSPVQAFFKRRKILARFWGEVASQLQGALSSQSSCSITFWASFS